MPSSGPSGFDYLAIYAALIATVAVAWPVFQYMEGRRRRIEVRAFFALVGYEPTIDALMFEARNKLQRPLAVTGCGFSLSKDCLAGGNMVMIPAARLGSRTFPSTIPPEDRFSCWVELDKLVTGVAEDGVDFTSFRYVYFVDALGKYHSQKMGKGMMDILAERATESQETAR